ncbi:hypothetical protein ACFFP9_13530 [Rhizobium paknamense]
MKPQTGSQTSRKRRQKGRPPESASVPARRGAEPQMAAATARKAWIRAVMRQDRFKAAALFAGFGLFLLLVSQAFPHDYGFTELGALFTFSVYDLVLAMLGIAVAVAQMETRRQFAITIGLFLAVLVPMLLFFDGIFALIRDSALGGLLYLVAPVAVASTGASLWLRGKWRGRAVAVAAMVVGFSFSLFLGLDDFGVGIPSFAIASVMSALWIILAPAFLLRCFRGPWLIIPARILGSWLIVIAVIVTVSLYVPLPIKAQPPLDLGAETPAGSPNPALQDKGAYGTMQSDGLLPDDEEEPQADPNAPSVFDSLKMPKIGP